MKALKLILVTTTMVAVLLSCSKSNNDDDEFIVADPQYPFKELMYNGNLDEGYSYTDKPFNLEVGFQFKSFKAGRITELGIRLPDNDEYRVTLWNAETKEVLATQQIISSADIFIFEAINPVNIISGVAYFVSVNTNDYYIVKNSESGELPVFPIESGDILLTGYGSSFGTSQTFPESILQNSCLGMVDIKFIENN